MTDQIGERLLFEGEELWMQWGFFPPLPTGHPRIVEADPGWVSTACWRGYQGTWEVRDGRLYLSTIRGRYKIVGEGPLLADWFTGALRISRGEHVLTIRNGIVTHSGVISAEPPVARMDTVRVQPSVASQERRSERVLCPDCGHDISAATMVVEDENTWYMLMPTGFDLQLSQAIHRLVNEMRPPAKTSSTSEDDDDVPF